MTRIFAILMIFALGLTACAAPPEQLGPDGKPLPRVYRIAKRDEAKIEYRMLDSINALRTAAGRNTIELNANLNAAAATHSRDMQVQNRPWHFGSDGSSPITRVARAGYPGMMLGENISETYETELETLSAWMEQPDTRDIILDRRATDMGFAWYQESNGKLWWTLIMGGRSGGASNEVKLANDITLTVE
ncbi:CAP domain-containing protein [Celeribacter sp.]|uniref:CAP domain-containing protein n=1 Tax=Celeribacter sp. TaxID=1890673 RepID=UPI003A8DB0B6